MKNFKRKIELYAAPIISVKDKSRAAFQSHVRIIDDKLGILMPETYLPITDKTKQSQRLFDWALEETVFAIQNLNKRNIHFDFFSIYMPQKVLEDDGCIENFVSYIENSKISFDNLALEIYSDVLFDKNSKSYKNAESLRDKGFKILLLNYASENYPISKISYIPADILCLDEFIVSCIASGDKNEYEYAMSVIELSKNLGKQIYCKQIDNKDLYDSLYEFIDFGCGKFFGNYVKHRYIRLRWLPKI
ncbi:MAG: EAL domain-containing protein [Acutalibacteraceae bacterium]